MSVKMNWKLFTFLSLICSISCNDVCVVKSGCKCVFPSGLGIDLKNALGDSSYLTTSNQNISYFFSCRGTKNLPQLITNVTNPCILEDYSLCMYDSSTQKFELLGRSTDVSFQSSEENYNFLVYDHKQPAHTTNIRLVCIQGYPKSHLFVDSTSEVANTNDTNLLLYSQYNCLAELEASENLSTGAVLLILFFVVLAVYLIGGILINSFFLGARGIEVVPNIDFWRGLPSLVHDGIRFIQNGCKVVPAADDSYDAI